MLFPCGFEDMGYHPRAFSKYNRRRFTKLFWKHKAIRWRSRGRSQHERWLGTYQVWISWRYSVCYISLWNIRFSIFSCGEIGQAREQTGAPGVSKVEGDWFKEKLEKPPLPLLCFLHSLAISFPSCALGNGRLLVACYCFMKIIIVSIFWGKKMEFLCHALFNQLQRLLYLGLNVVANVVMCKRSHRKISHVNFLILLSFVEFLRFPIFK